MTSEEDVGNDRIPTAEEVIRDTERGDAFQLVGMTTVIDQYGNHIPLYDDDGNEILGVGTKGLGEK